MNEGSVLSVERERVVEPTVDEVPGPPRTAAAARSPLSFQRRLLVSCALMLVLVCLIALLNLMVLGRVQHGASQQRLFDRFRSQLASGTAPVGGIDGNGRLVQEGTPVAYLEIPSIGLEEVVVEGTRSSTLASGPGHRRDTVLPGQVGTSVIFGRRAMFGGPFAALSSLRSGDAITVTTAQGEFNYRVVGVRREGDPVPSGPASGGSRITLTTADGTAFFPTGVVRVDADLDGTAVGGGPRQVSASTLPAEEQAMSGDPSTLWALVLWLQALLIASAAFTWAWSRWSRMHAWVVFAPLVLLLCLLAWGQAARLLPNLA